MLFFTLFSDKKLEKSIFFIITAAKKLCFLVKTPFWCYIWRLTFPQPEIITNGKIFT